MDDTELTTALVRAEAFLADPQADAPLSGAATPEARLAYTGGQAHGLLAELVAAVRKTMPDPLSS